MTRSFPIRIALALALACATAGAQTEKVKGMIEGRSGPTILLRSADSQLVTVMLTDRTQVGQIQGVLKARSKQMSMAALIPGLAIEVEGMYDDRRQLIAKSVKFKGDDLERAKSIQAGMHETQAQARQNKEELEKHNAALQAQREALRQQQEALAAERERVEANRSAIAANQAAIAANRAKIEAAVARFGQLDDYYILDEETVYFGSGKTAVEAKFKTALAAFAERAKTVEAYMIQVIGYASSSGSEELNQKLSEDRAHNVINFLLQRCGIPLTNVMAPGAMGESQQIGDQKARDGEAQNRRVTVRVLQNKGVAGITDSDRKP